MIYLLKSYGPNGKELFKIGYTKDENYKSRMYSYESHNPCIEVVCTIPNATEVQEKKLHYKFKDHLIFKNEWFDCNPQIESYLKTATLEDLDRLPELTISPAELSRLRQIIRLSFNEIQRRAVNSVTEVLKIISDELLRSCKNCTNKPFNDEYIYQRLQLTPEEIGAVKKAADRLNNGDYSAYFEFSRDILHKFDEVSQFPNKMKVLCESNLTTEELGYVLNQLPVEYSKYYNVLGPSKILSWSCRKNYLEIEYKKVMFSDQSTLEEMIYLEFREGDRFTLNYIAERISEIYKKLNYPYKGKASILRDYFQCNTTSIVVNLGGEKTTKAGYKLIKKLR